MNYHHTGAGGGSAPHGPSINISVSAGGASGGKSAVRPTRIIVRPRGVSKSWSGTPLPGPPARRGAGTGSEINKALVMSRARSPACNRTDPVLAQFKNDMAYTMYKLRRRGRHVERDIAQHYDNVRQIAWEHEEKEFHGGKFHRKCLKQVPLHGDGPGGNGSVHSSNYFQTPRSVATSTGSNMTTPRVSRSVAAIGGAQTGSQCEHRGSGFFRPSVDRDLMPPVD